MLSHLRPRSVYDVMAAIGCFAALATGTAYAANTIGSADIIDEAIVSADLKNYGVKRSDIGLNSINTDRIEDGAITNPDIGLNAVSSGKVLNNTLTGDDINESTLAVTQGAGTRVLANRLVLTPGQENVVLFTIPGLGEVQARCISYFADMIWINTTAGPVDSWSHRDVGAGLAYGAVTPPAGGRFITQTYESGAAKFYSEISVGVGNSPGARRIATIHGNVHQAGENQPCGVQATATYWEIAG